MIAVMRMPKAKRGAVILAAGKGTRMGELTKAAASASMHVRTTLLNGSCSTTDRSS